MQLQYLYISKYKNLEEFTWDIAEAERSHIICIIGQNGAGKSNLLEAILHIFNCLHYHNNTEPLFDFEIKYHIALFDIKISGKKGTKGNFSVSIDGEDVPFSRIVEQSGTWIYPKHDGKIEGLLPENLIAYYSGYSKRIRRFFEQVNADYATIFRQGKTKNLPPLLLIEPVHFKIILLSLFSYDPSFTSIYKDFLLDYFNIEAISSFSITIKKHTNWESDSDYTDFFGAKGVIRAFLEHLDNLQKAESGKNGNKEELPIKGKNRSGTVVNVTYQFSHHESLIELKKPFGFEADIFKLLHILHQSGYLADITVYIKKTDVSTPLSFDDLSEGEQQLLAIKGSIELLWGKNNLFLWDEPDTYLNPRWQWNLLPDLKKQVGDRKEDQFILTTHSPVLLSTSENGTFEMENGKLSSIYNTYGLSVNEVLQKQEINSQPDDVKALYEEYLSLVQQGKGKTDEALKMRAQLEEIWGENQEDLLKANVYLKLYE